MEALLHLSRAPGDLSLHNVPVNVTAGKRCVPVRSPGRSVRVEPRQKEDEELQSSSSEELSSFTPPVFTNDELQRRLRL